MTKEVRGFERAGVSGDGSTKTVRVRLLPVLLGMMLCSGPGALLRMREPAVIVPGSAYYAARMEEKRALLARIQYQLSREAAGGAA